jgi:methionine sulfoxide reductase catalytic subunit
MASIKIPKAWEIPEKLVTPESVYLNRRQILQQLGFSALGAAGLYWAYGEYVHAAIVWILSF